MRKLTLIFLLTTSIFLAGCKKQTPTQTSQSLGDILQKATDLYAQAKDKGEDLSSGPCLGKIADDWVVDIAHNPRQPVDDKPENQCTDFREGRAHHFVELDPEGKLIQTY